MKNIFRFVICCFICLLLVSGATAKKRRPRPSVWGVPEIYSDMYLEPETGDVGGTQVVILKSYYGDWAAVIIASGIANDPVLVPLNTEHYPNIEFTLPNTPPYEGYGKFTGKITRSGLILWSHGERVGLLRKQNR